jgi:XTP/dITP diphosphohydrolase
MADKPFQTLVLATRNLGKLREFRELLGARGLEVMGLNQAGLDRDHDETGSSFGENARLKALAYSAETVLPVLADDSGLEVFSLDGRPGVHSARYAGPGATDGERIRKLLSELERTPGQRDARFVCALALARLGRLLLETEGECRGQIAREPEGGGGFGYDPVFCLPELGKTFAQLTPAEKNRCSHRARAVDALIAQWHLLI